MAGFTSPKLLASADVSGPQNGQQEEILRRRNSTRDEAKVGAEIFSVPPRDMPSTGVYVLPEAAFKIRDLDSGMEYTLDKVCVWC